MAAYITRHLPPIHTAPRHLTSIHDDGLKTTIIPPLPLRPASQALPATTSSSAEPPSTSASSPPSTHHLPGPGEPGYHVFDQETLAHFLNSFHKHYSSHPTTTSPSHPLGTTHPRFDLVESKTTYTIYGELPGLKRSDVLVETNDLMFAITISGVLQRSIPTEDERLEEVAEEYGGADENEDPEKGLHFHVKERRVGQFKREFHLPMGLGNMAAVSASMEDGLLTVRVPKTVAEVYREGLQHKRKVVVGGEVGEGEEEL